MPSPFIINIIDYLLTFLSKWSSWSKNTSVVVSLAKPVHPCPLLSVLVFVCLRIGFITLSLRKKRSLVRFLKLGKAYETVLKNWIT